MSSSGGPARRTSVPSVAAGTSRSTIPTVRLAVISEGLNAWPLYVAQTRRFFEQQGLDVQVTLTGSSAKQLEALNEGGYDIGLQQVDHIVRGVEQGSELFIFMAHAHAPDLSLVAAPAVTSFADFRGRVLAVDGARSGYALLLRKLLADQGLKDEDYRFREFGGSRERFEALRNGAAAASLLNPPFDRWLVAGGYRRLGTIAGFFPTYPGPVAAARRSWAARHKAELVAFIRALDSAYAWLQDGNNRDQAIAILQARLKTDHGLASEAFDRVGARPRPEVSADGVRQVMDVVWDAEGFTQPKGAPGRYIDLSYCVTARRPRSLSVQNPTNS